jgi:hypothetical protein
MRAAEPYSVQVLHEGGELLAGFVRPADAVRFAALVCEPEMQPLLRRASDGAVRKFTPGALPLALLTWLAPPAAA